MRFGHKNIIKLLSLVLLTFAALTCSENLTDTPEGNLAPDTFLFLYPDEGSSISQQKSRIRVNWWGDDPDGLVLGYYIKWEGLDDTWGFTTKNDSIFSLPIGTVDTNFIFKVISVDSEGNGKYDKQVKWGNEDLGPEPFVDANSNQIYDEGETYYDIGSIDLTPASRQFPIKNSSPEIEWNDISVVPLESFPVITVGWETDDLDGKETIVGINLALNDTTNPVALPGSASLVTLRIIDKNNPLPEMEILLNGDEGKIFQDHLQNLVLDSNNRLYVQAVDISGSKSAYVPLPDTSRDWFIKKPKGNFLIVDDFPSGSTVKGFYDGIFSQIGGGAISGGYDILDLEATDLPYASITFLETVKLFKYIFWYSGSSPSLDLASISIRKFLNSGGKAFLSMTLQDSSDAFSFDLSTLQNFLPIDKLGQKKPVGFLFPGADLLPASGSSGYLPLKTATTIGFVRTFVSSTLSAIEIYDLSSSQLNGNISFMSNKKDLFFIGLPLNQCDGVEGSVSGLLEKVFIQEFGLSP